MNDYEVYQTVQQYVDEAEQEHGVPAELINSVIHSESTFQPTARSEKGNMGLMQISPEIAKEYGVTDPLDPQQNINAGARYLGKLLELYGGDQRKALAAYHMGITGVREKAPGPKTRAYVQKTMENYSNPGTVEKLHTPRRAGWKKRTLAEWNRVVNET